MWMSQEPCPDGQAHGLFISQLAFSQGRDVNATLSALRPSAAIQRAALLEHNSKTKLASDAPTTQSTVDRQAPWLELCF